MATVTEVDLRQWAGKTVVDSRGRRIGKVEDVYFDEATREPEWALVHTGLLGLRRNFVPVSDARRIGETSIQVPWTEDEIRRAPSVENEGELSQDEERQLYSHYGLDWEDSDSPTTFAGTVRHVSPPHGLQRLGGRQG